MDKRPSDLADQSSQLAMAIQQLRQTRDTLPEGMRAGIDAHLAEVQHQRCTLAGATLTEQWNTSMQQNFPGVEHSWAEQGRRGAANP